MSKINPYKFILCLKFFFIISQASAQYNFKFTAGVSKIQVDDFYKISLPPVVVSKCNPTLSDIRIMDEEGKQVPYLLKIDEAVKTKGNVMSLPILLARKQKDKQTHIIIGNTTGKGLNGLVLSIKNMEAHRSFSVSGSDDSAHWFIIKENIYLENESGIGNENIHYSLSFPKSNYRYFQLIIIGQNILPFNMVKAEVKSEDLLEGNYLEVPTPVIFQNDSSNKFSYVVAQFNESFQLNKIAIRAEGPKYFNRPVEIADLDAPAIITHGYLCSDSANVFLINSKSARLAITIKNDDNHPLKIKSVQGFQLTARLLAYLQKDRHYYLYFGDSSLAQPSYDLKFFSDTAEKNPIEITLKNIELNKIPGAAAQSPRFNYQRIILWLSLILALLVLSFFTFKFLSEINKGKNSFQD